MPFICSPDMHMNNISTIIARLTAVQVGYLPLQYSIYRDKAYNQQPPCGFSAFRAPAGGVLLPQQAADNRVMTSLRIGVEWAFGKVMACNKYLTHHIGLKVFAMSVGDHYFCAVLIANTSTCLYGSQASVYFNCRPPTLGEYFNEPTVDV